jgi:hypothetical protein
LNHLEKKLKKDPELNMEDAIEVIIYAYIYILCLIIITVFVACNYNIVYCFSC